MSKTWAIVLSIIGGLFLLGLIAVAGVIYWVYQNKDKWVQSVEQIGKDAKEFGAKTDNEGCLKEALARHKRDKSLTGQISTQGFLLVCLQASEPSRGFCDGVPQQDERTESADWTLKKCSDAGMQNDQSCKLLLGAVQSYCHRDNYSPEK